MSATKIAREEKGKTNFVIEVRDLEVIENLTLEQMGEVFAAIKNFVLYDQEPNMQTVSGMSASFFIKTIEDNNKKWLETCKKNSQSKQEYWNKKKEEEEKGK